MYKKKDYTPNNFNCVQLESVEKHKSLGLTLSHKLGWSVHINALLESIDSMSDMNMTWIETL